MNKRATLSSHLGKTNSKRNIKPLARTVSALTPYSGPWEFKQAAHLLKRTTFGPNWGQIQTSINDGLQNTIAELLTLNPLSQTPSPPINYYYEDDPVVAVGETWVSSAHSPNHNLPRIKSLEGWISGLIMNERTSLVEKMTLFWHNHFVVAENRQDVKKRYHYIRKLRENSLGNVRNLTKIMTIDPLMMIYLNGKSNTNVAPNENYARELLELFTIGKGPIIAPGDYSNYTETDIAEIARVLTGLKGTGTFNASQHDEGDKQLSYHFNNEIITNAGADEYKILIDIIFQQDEVSRFMCRNIYRWFVHYNITDDIEIDVIEPLAQILRDNDYEIAPVLECLFSSEHFYEEERMGCMIKNPWDFTASLIKQFEPQFPSDPAIYYETFRVIFQGTLGMQMEYLNPPNVAGWKAYYQAPAYYRLWLNSVTLPFRDLASTTLSTSGVPLFVSGTPFPIDFINIEYLQMVDNFSNPFDINDVIDDFIRLLFPKDIDQDQKDILKEVILPGLEDFEWTDEYGAYLSDPSNTNLADSINSRLRNLVSIMLKMPEYQLM